jgi:signal peptidase II
MPKPGGNLLNLFIIVAVVIIFDQLSKHLIASLMEIGQSIPVINGFFYLTYVRNPGAAFGMFPYQTALFIGITIAVAALILYYYRVLSKDHKWLRLGLALQLGGALGNLIDRVRAGYVIDFLDFTVFPPVFNLADSAIVIGIAIFLFAFWREPELRSERS